MINGTIRYYDNGSGVYITNPDDGTVFQKEVFDIIPENENSSIKVSYEDISSQSSDANILLTNGVMLFNAYLILETNYHLSTINMQSINTW